MKYTILALLAAALVTGCDNNQGTTGDYSDSTKGTINEQKEAVDDAAKDAKKDAEANAEVEKARIEANKDAANAQLEAEKKKVEANEKVNEAQKEAVDK